MKNLSKLGKVLERKELTQILGGVPRACIVIDPTPAQIRECEAWRDRNKNNSQLSF